MTQTTYKARPIPELLDAIKAKHNLPSDYKLALFLGLGETAVANYRHGRSLPEFDAIQAIAKGLGEDGTQLMLEVEAQRAKSTGAKVAWAVALGVYVGAVKPASARSTRKVDGGGKPALNITSATSARERDGDDLYIVSTGSPLQRLASWLAPAPRAAFA